MGIAESKSPLERRNTVARRSQRRTIHNIKSKVDKVCQDIKKFKGIDEDENFKALLSELEHHRNELKRKSKDLQPQVRTVYEATVKKIEEGAEALRVKLEENREKARKKEEERAEKARQKEEKGKKKNDIQEVIEEVPHEEEQEEVEQKLEELNLAENPDKRQTVELKFVQIYPPTQAPTSSEIVNDTEINVTNSEVKIVSPEEKRKSILKVGGVAVMPGAMLNEISTKSLRISTNYKMQSKENLLEDPTARINEIIENLQAIECQIADFVGRKQGTQYNRIRDKLNQYLVELSQADTRDEFLAEQVKMCKNYVSSCMSFLDEKAIDNKKHDTKYDSKDDVFLPDNNNTISASNDVHVKFQKLSKTTAI